MARIAGGSRKKKTTNKAIVKKLWKNFTAGEQKDKTTIKPPVKKGKFAKVEDSLGRSLTSSEKKKLKKANYNKDTHTVVVKTDGDGEVYHAIKKKKLGTESE